MWWRGGATGNALDLRSTGRGYNGFKSYSGQKLHNNLGQVVHTYVHLSPSSITWYRPRGGDALRLGRYPQAWSYAEGCHYFPPGLRIPSQPQSITAPWPVPSYTARWQRHIGVNNLSKVVMQGCYKPSPAGWLPVHRDQLRAQRLV